MELTSVRYEYGGERKVGVSWRELAVCGTGGAHGVLERGEGSERAYWCGIVRVGSCVWDRTESGVSARTGVRRVLVYGAKTRMCGIVCEDEDLARVLVRSEAGGAGSRAGGVGSRAGPVGLASGCGSGLPGQRSRRARAARGVGLWRGEGFIFGGKKK